MGMETDQLVRVLMAERNKLLAYAWSITGDFATVRGRGAGSGAAGDGQGARSGR